MDGMFVAVQQVLGSIPATYPIVLMVVGTKMPLTVISMYNKKHNNCSHALYGRTH